MAVRSISVEPQGQVGRAQAEQSQTQASTDRLNSAINGGRILPTDPNNAFTALQDLKATASSEQYQEAENQLQDRAGKQSQQVLLRYLEGDETPQSRAEFSSKERATWTRRAC